MVQLHELVQTRDAVTLALMLASLGGGACGCRRPHGAPDPDRVAVDSGVATSTRTRGGGTDVTFIAVSDTHLGFDGLEATNRAMVARIDTIAGHAYPATIGGVVSPPRGLFVTGDLTEWGQTQEWEPFLAIYGKAKVPLFEMIGNHDKVQGPWVGEQVAARHGGRFYAVDFGDLHAVSLSEAPDDAGLAWLESDLAKLANDVPLVLFFHLPLAGPWSDDLWFGSGDYKDRLFRILRKRNVAAIFHGHHHATDHYVWRGIDVFKPGAVKDNAHTFAVVHVTDDRFTLGSYEWETDRWASAFVKPLPPLRTSSAR